MTIRHIVALFLGCWLGAASGFAQAPEQEGPSNHAVLLPPQTFDGPGKVPNNTRERTGQWSLMAGVYLMQPVFENNSAFLVNAGNATRQIDFGHNLNVAPNVWIGYVSDRGWGVRGRWVEFDYGASEAYATGGGETVTGMSALTLGRLPIAGVVAARGDLAVNVADFQITNTWTGARWSHLVGIGGRYTHISQGYLATIANTLTRIDLNSSHNLNAGGPSFSLETDRRIGDTPFSLYGQLHGAILFGNANETHSAVNNGEAQFFTRAHSDVLPVGELELGAQYRRDLGNALVFVQAGFVGQIWWGGGNASNLDPLGFTSASNQNFGFLGLALRAGVRY